MPLPSEEEPQASKGFNLKMAYLSQSGPDWRCVKQVVSRVRLTTVSFGPRPPDGDQWPLAALRESEDHLGRARLGREYKSFM